MVSKSTFNQQIFAQTKLNYVSVSCNEPTNMRNFSIEQVDVLPQYHDGFMKISCFIVKLQQKQLVQVSAMLRIHLP